MFQRIYYCSSKHHSTQEIFCGIPKYNRSVWRIPDVRRNTFEVVYFIPEQNIFLHSIIFVNKKKITINLNRMYEFKINLKVFEEIKIRKDTWVSKYIWIIFECPCIGITFHIYTIFCRKYSTLGKNSVLHMNYAQFKFYSLKGIKVTHGMH